MNLPPHLNFIFYNLQCERNCRFHEVIICFFNAKIAIAQIAIAKKIKVCICRNNRFHDCPLIV